MKHPNKWSRQDLHTHLQHAVDLELWTIPLYLTSLYSIKGLQKTEPRYYPKAAKLILSVVVQEMLHLELVCNIANALGYSPQFNTPEYDSEKGIPFIHPDKNHLPPELMNFKVQPQPLNEESLKLFCAIEIPHLDADPDWDKMTEFCSIAEFYEALKLGVQALWDEHYVGDESNTRQKYTFNEYGTRSKDHHGFSQIVDSAETALLAIEAIIEQGEGAHGKHVPADFQPHIPKGTHEYDASWYKGDWSHYDKFHYLLKHPETIPEVYAIDPDSTAQEEQQKLKEYFTGVLSDMEREFNAEGDQMSEEFWTLMMGLGEAITEVWKKGACPDFGSSKVQEL